jgi:toxin ParE1/3/4
MSVPVIVLPKARQDILEIADFLAGQSLETTMRFLDQVETSFERLGQMPEQGTVCRLQQPEMQDIRVWPVKGFPKHLIFHRPEPDRLVIIRVLHGAQDWETLF